MGCGKSSVGRRLSELLCCPFMDLDEEIEAWAGKSIPEIFAEDGEAGFRAIEAERLGSILSAEQRCLGRSLRLWSPRFRAAGGTVLDHLMLSRQNHQKQRKAKKMMYHLKKLK